MGTEPGIVSRDCYLGESLTSSLSGKLTDLLGEGHVLPGNPLGEYSVDGMKPQAVAQPDTREGIAQTLRWASVEKLAVVPWGGGTQQFLGNVPRKVDLVLDLSRHNRLLDFQPADLTVTVEAGMTLDNLRWEVAQAGKLVPLEAPLAEKATVGGILAASSSGPLRYAYGLVREWLIGISVVGAGGEETKAGGRVVKNVTGYDLNKLYTGSLGTLGVIVEATFKLAPLPLDAGALIAAFPSFQEAITEARRLLGQVYAPQGIQVVDAAVAARLNLPIEVSGDAAVVLAQFNGRPRSVQRRLSESLKLLGDAGATKLERLGEVPSLALLSRLTDLGCSDDTVPQLQLKINLPPSAIAGAAAWHQETILGPSPGMVADPGFGGLKWFWWDQASTIDSSIVDSIGRLRQLAKESGGSVVVERCPLPAKQQIDVWGDSPQELEVMRRIKQSFDPSGILNPGRFVGKL